MSLYSKLVNNPDSFAAYGDALNELTVSKRQLLTATLEISPICNFTCPFCYIRKSEAELRASGETILRFDAWKRMIDELHTLGACNLTLTGGECMLHPDFVRIYRYAYDLGLDISLLTNASALTDEICELFRSCPPYRIFITLYGASEDTYETVCGNRAFFPRVCRNIDRLNEMHMNLILQITVDKDNLEDLNWVYEFSKERQIPFRYGASFFSYGRCSEEIAEQYTADEEKLHESSLELYFKMKNTTKEEYQKRPVQGVSFDTVPVVEKGMPCQAGRNACCIDYRGRMRPCVAFDAVCIEAAQRPIADCWQELVRACDEVPCLTVCTNCLHKSHCNLCIAQHYNDTHEFGKPSPRLCYKCLHPQQAAEVEERFAREGHLRSDIDVIKA